MKGTWQPPGTESQDPGALKAFGVTTIPVTRLSMVDPPAHPGFQAVQAKIARRAGVSSARAGAILAASTRRASARAKRTNPRLARVKGTP